MASILIVEDEPVIAENLQALLMAKGHKVAVSLDGADAVEHVRKIKPDLVLLDVMLPRLSGLDVCAVIKGDAATKSVRVIMITGLGRMGDVEKAFAQGADDYIIKPFDSERLLKKLDKVLGA